MTNPLVSRDFTGVVIGAVVLSSKLLDPPLRKIDSKSFRMRPAIGARLFTKSPERQELSHLVKVDGEELVTSGKGDELTHLVKSGTVYW